MKKCLKRIIATVLTVIMLFSFLPLAELSDFDWSIFYTKAKAIDSEKNNVYKIEIADDDDLIESTYSYSDYVSDEIAQKFVEFFCDYGSGAADDIQNFLTGKTAGTPEIMKSVISKSAIIFNVNASGSGALSDLSNIGYVLRFASNTVSFVESSKNFLNTDSAFSKTMSALETGSSILEFLGFPLLSGFKTIITSVELTVSVTSFLQQYYDKESLTIYEYSLNLAYYAGDELPLPPKEDTAYKIKYLEYFCKRSLDKVNSGGGGSSSQTHTHTFSFSGETDDMVVFKCTSCGKESHHPKYEGSFIPQFSVKRQIL